MVARTQRIRMQRILREAEGYLELNMPQQTLETLERLGEQGASRGHSLYLRGEALRMMRRYREALTPLEEAADLCPSNVQIWLALGWCYKRTGQLALAVEAMEKAVEVQPHLPLLHYNLACYLSLAGEKRRALRALAHTLELDDNYRFKVIDEPDFNALRSDPEFLSMTTIIV
jgi:Flp pilus assembly protein TadD